MKKTNKFVTYALCLLLAITIACTSLMVSATDSNETTTSKRTGEDLSYVPTTLPTEQDVTDIISEIVSKNELESELSSVGADISEKSEEAENFLTKLIDKLEAFIEMISQYLKQIFRISSFD